MNENQKTLRYWVTIYVPGKGTQDLPAAFSVLKDAKVWAQVQSLSSRDICQVWCCHETMQPVVLLTYSNGLLIEASKEIR